VSDPFARVPPAVRIVEVGPRDGLQNEPGRVALEDKVRLVEALADAGLPAVEAGAFVSPRWVPQMADAAEVMAGITRRTGVRFAALVPNIKGLQRALDARVDEVAVFASASESFSRRNLNCTIAESLERFRPVCTSALAAGVTVRGYVSCVTDCPFEGPVAPDSVAEVATALAAMGCAEISLGDTIGRGTPERVGAMLEAVLGSLPASRLAGHFHDTAGRALENIEVSLGLGLRVFDAAVGGLGGCPFAPGASGNVATEAVAARLADLGFETGIDMNIVLQASEIARKWRSG
jgi:hydroxymethylglutaryl-CoA lyase